MSGHAVRLLTLGIAAAALGLLAGCGTPGTGSTRATVAYYGGDRWDDPH